MKNLLKLAMGAAIAGALVIALMKRAVRRQDAPADVAAVDVAADTPMPTELVADSSSVGEGSGDDRVLLPDDGQVAPPTLNS